MFNYDTRIEIDLQKPSEMVEKQISRQLNKLDIIRSFHYYIIDVYIYINTNTFCVFFFFLLVPNLI